MKDPRIFLDHLIKEHKYKLKGDEPLPFHQAAILVVTSMEHDTINQRSP